MKNIMILGMLMFAICTCCGCGRNENPFYTMSDEQQSARKVVDQVQNIKQYAVEQQANEMKNLEETK